MKGYSPPVGPLWGLTSIAWKLILQHWIQATEGKAMIFLNKHFPSATQKHSTIEFLKCWNWWRGLVCPVWSNSSKPSLILPLLKRSIKQISHVCGLSFSYLTNLACKRHIKASSDFAARILGDHQHLLHDDLSRARSHTSTRSRFKLLPSKTDVYRNSVLPTLLRILVDKNAELNHYIQKLSWIYTSYSPFPYCSTALASTT